jgi:hypothetical protein
MEFFLFIILPFLFFFVYLPPRHKPTAEAEAARAKITEAEAEAEAARAKITEAIAEGLAKIAKGRAAMADARTRRAKGTKAEAATAVYNKALAEGDELLDKAIAEAQAVRDKALAESNVWEEKNVVFDVYKKVSDDIFDTHFKAWRVASEVYWRVMDDVENDDDDDDENDDEDDGLWMQQRYDDHLASEFIRKGLKLDDSRGMQRRYDHVPRKQVQRIYLLFGGAILGMCGLFPCPQGRGLDIMHVVNDWVLFYIHVCMLAFFAGVVNSIKLKLFSYRCPQCRASLAQVPGQDGDPVLYICPTCKVEWATGSRISSGD